VTSPLQSADGTRLADAPTHEQTDALERALRCNPNVLAIMVWAREFDLPCWYLGAGAIAQTVWNQLHGFDPAHGIKDYDLVFFDSHDLSEENEDRIEASVRRDLGVNVDVKNEARVHLWYHTLFGRTIPQYQSTEHAISTWPTTASSVGVRYEEKRFIVCAPFGLRDLFSMTVRANPTLVDRRVYEAKAARWSGIWPRLSVLPWPGTDE
jgi:uncharacterized protein